MADNSFEDTHMPWQNVEYVNIRTSQKVSSEKYRKNNFKIYNGFVFSRAVFHK